MRIRPRSVAVPSLVISVLGGGCYERATLADPPDGSTSTSTADTSSTTQDTSGGPTSVDGSTSTGAAESLSEATTSEESESSMGTTGEAPEPVELRWPWNGATTGSVWATDAALAELPRRPSFRWTESAAASEYQIQLDDSCELADFASCTFESPEVEETVETPAFTPADDLPVAIAAPVGRRYYWRVRACAASVCSPYSAVRYVDVGRQPHDFNGDGFSDVAFGAYLQDGPEINEGAAFVYHGSASGLPTSPSRTLDNPDDEESAQFGVQLSTPGDLNADGFGDLVVVAYRQDHGAADAGAAYVYYGGVGGIGETPSLTLADPDDEAGAEFGISVRGAGDVNTDGFADLLVGAHRSDASETDGGAGYLYLGSEAGVPALPTTTFTRPDDTDLPLFGGTFGGGGDLDGDGYADIFIGSYAASGVAFLYRGGADGPAATPDMVLDNPSGDANGAFATNLVIADVNGDDLGDLLIGAYLQDGVGVDQGAVFVYLGDTAGLPATPDQTLANPTDEPGGRFGVSFGIGDVDSDGDLDVLVGADRQDNPETDEGAAFLFGCGPMGVASRPTTVLDNPLDQAGGHMGIVGSAGDVDGDGYADVIASPWRQDNEEADEGNAGVYFGGPSGLDATGQTLDNPTDQPGGHFGVPSAD